MISFSDIFFGIIQQAKVAGLIALHQHARWFVNSNQMVVFKYDIEFLQMNKLSLKSIPSDDSPQRKEGFKKKSRLG
jgi:hypothetical protein